MRKEIFNILDGQNFDIQLCDGAVDQICSLLIERLEKIPKSYLEGTYEYVKIKDIDQLIKEINGE